MTQQINGDQLPPMSILPSWSHAERIRNHACGPCETTSLVHCQIFGIKIVYAGVRESRLAIESFGQASGFR